MSDGMNKVMLFGNLGANPVLRYTPAGAAVLHMRLATNDSYMDKEKKLQTRTDWHDIVVWGARAEGLSKVLSKGSSILVEGSLRTSSFEKDGVKRFRTEVVATDIHFAGRKAGMQAQDPAAKSGNGKAAILDDEYPA